MKHHRKYFDRYAEPECHLLENFPGKFQQGLVIPIFKEDACVAHYFSAFAEANKSTLLIIIVNRPDDHTDTDWCQSFLHNFQNKTLTWQSQHLSLYALQNNSAALLIDRCIIGAPIPSDQGVGLARKIGADILCYLIDQDIVHSKWIANTDADARLPADYFVTLQSQEKSAAIVFPYQHIFHDEDTSRLPTLLYEFSLHYYVEGLRYAGSPYGYHTIGSIIAAHQEAYIIARGFPKRSGGEDFYLLNKLAKIEAIQTLKQPTITIQSRLSDRVPFGTGPAVIKLSKMENPLSANIYHPDSFHYLKSMILLLDHIAHCKQKTDLTVYLRDYPSKKDGTVCTASLIEIATQLGLPNAINHCFNNAKTASIRKKHLQHWFDGFRTLKFIHLLRDKKLGTSSYQDILTRGYSFDKSKPLVALAHAINNELSRQK